MNIHIYSHKLSMTHYNIELFFLQESITFAQHLSRTTFLTITRTILSKAKDQFQRNNVSMISDINS